MGVIAKQIFLVPKYIVNKLCIYLNIPRLVSSLSDVMRNLSESEKSPVLRQYKSVPLSFSSVCSSYFLLHGSIILPSQGMLSHWGAITPRQVICLSPTAY
jgi:hypothetical protein